MAFATDRRTQSAIVVATGGLVVGLVWVGLTVSGTLPVSDAARYGGFAFVTTLLLTINLWLAWKSLVPLLRTARGEPDEDEYVASGPFHRKQRGLRR